jgi:hypothetical protein
MFTLKKGRVRTGGGGPEFSSQYCGKKKKKGRVHCGASRVHLFLTLMTPANPGVLSCVADR